MAKNKNVKRWKTTLGQAFLAERDKAIELLGPLWDELEDIPRKPGDQVYCIQGMVENELIELGRDWAQEAKEKSDGKEEVGLV